MSFLFPFFIVILLCPVASAQINTSFFPYKDTYQVRGSLSDLTVMHLTGDHLKDVAVTDFANDNVNFFYNTGGCPNSLSHGTSMAADHGPSAIETADVNQDGRLDFFVLNTLSHTVCIYINHRSPKGVVTVLPSGTYALSESCNAMQANDIDGDGKQDLLITDGSSGWVYVLKNRSTQETIQFDSPMPILNTGLDLKGLIAEDFNGDGKPDLVLAGVSNGARLLLFQNQSTSGNMSFLSPIDYAIDISPVVLKTGDMDGDGKKDLVVGDAQHETILILHNEFSGGQLEITSFASPVYIETLSGIADIVLTDLNEDHQLDLVATHFSEDYLTVLTNNGPQETWDEGIFLAAEKLWSGDGPLALCIEDLNNDGRKDILHTNQEFRNLVVQYKKNTLRGSSTLPFPPSAANYYSRYNPGDFVLTAVSSGILTWYADSTLHQLMGAGNQFKTPWLEHTDTFYVTNSESCNESDPVTVIAAIRCSIMPPEPVSAFRCGPGSLSLEAISNEQICWYKRSVKDTVVIARGNVFSIPYLERSDTFYVAALKEECRSQRTAVVASIFPSMHTAEVKAEEGICSSSGIHVYIPASQKGIQYYLLENESLHSYLGNGAMLSLGNYPAGTSLQVSSANPCDSIVLNIEYLDSQNPNIPNLVTTNGDQKNDTFFISNLPSSSQLSVYNSWGTQVFSSDDYQNNWGTGEPNGIYFYEMQFELCGKSEYRKGWFQIISNR